MNYFNCINSLIIEGYVSKPSKNGSFTIVVERKNKTDDGKYEDETGRFDVESYGKMAEICDKHAVKGKRVEIVGRIKLKTWKRGGKTYSKVCIVNEFISFKKEKK